jgi:hypothetical protein
MSIHGTIHILGGEENLVITSASNVGSGSHAVSGEDQARQFLALVLGRNLSDSEWWILSGPPPNGIPVDIDERDYLAILLRQ